jgi:tape measure domain-containing protein
VSFDVAKVGVQIGVSGADGAVRELDKVGTGAKDLGEQFQSLRNMWMGLASTLGLSLGVRELLQMADAVTTLRNRLELATGSAIKASKAFDDLFAAAQSSRTSFTELGATYATLARAAQPLGISQNQLLTVTQAIGNAMAISGGSAQGMQAALVQLGQGMSAGVLRGEELNSVMEQSPRLAQALADGLGVPIGELRKLGEAGAITAEKVIGALSKTAPQLAKEVESATMTFSQAMTVLDNSTTRFVGVLDSASGASKALGTFIRGIASALDAVASTIKGNETAFAILASGLLAGGAVATAVLGWTALKGVLVLMAPLFAGVAVAMTPVVATIAAIAAAIGVVVAAIYAFKNSKAGLDNRIAALEGPQSIYGPRGEERKSEADKLRAQRALMQLDGVDTSNEDRRYALLGRAEAQRVKDSKELHEIRMKLAGVDAGYIATVQQLAEMVDRGTLSTAEYARITAMLTAETKAGKEAAKAAADALKLRDQATAKALKEQADAIAARNKLMMDADADVEAYFAAQLNAEKQAVDSANAAVAAAQAEFDNYGKLKSQIAETTLLKLKEKLATQELGTTAYASTFNQIEAQEKLLAVLRKGEARELMVKQAEESSAAWKNLADDIGRGLTDSLMRAFEAGKGFFDTLWNGIKNLFKTTVLKLALQPVQTGMNQLLAGALGQAQPNQQGGIFGSLSSLGSLYGMGKSVGGTIGGWFGIGGAAGAAGTGITAGSAAGSGLYASAGLGGTGAGLSVGTGAGATMGTGTIPASGASAGLGWAGLIAAAVAVGVNNAQKDWSAGFDGNAARRAGDGVAMGSLGVGTVFAETSQLLQKLGLNQKWADILSMSTGFAAHFGLAAPKVEGRNIVGTLSGEGFSGSYNERLREKGGFFRSDNVYTRSSDVAPQVVGAINEMAGQVRNSVKAYADALGLPVQAIDAFTKAINIDVTFATPEEAAKRVEEALKGYAEGLFSTFDAAIGALKKMGESTEQAVQRLAALQTFSKGLADLGGVFGRVAGLGVDARESLIALAGGMDQLKAQAQGYVQNYYNRDEIAGIKAREIQAQLAGVGITQDVNSRDEFRKLVDNLDVSTELGRKQLATLLGVADSFTSVADFLAETGGTLSGAAAAAPAAGTLGSLFTTAATEQVTAINAVEAAVNAVKDAIVDLRDSMVQPGGSGGNRGWGPEEVVNLP